MDDPDSFLWEPVAGLILNWMLLVAFALHSAFWFVLGIVFAKVPCKLWNVTDYYVAASCGLAAIWFLVSLAAMVSRAPRKALLPLIVVAAISVGVLYLFMPMDLPDRACPGST